MVSKALIIIPFLFIGSLIYGQKPSAPEGFKWKIVEPLTDEFNDDVLDATKWDDFHPHWSGRPPSNFKKGNAFLQDGNLRLKSDLLKDPSEVDDPFSDIWVNAAACVSKDWSAKPGYYYETSMKASNLSMTSSYWFRVGKFSEIDVIEHIGNPSVDSRDDDLPFEYHANTHYYGPHAGLKNLPASYKMSNMGRDRFHVFGLWWKDPNTLYFYHNGEKVMEITPRVPFDENLKMIFDTEVFPFAQAGVPTIGLPLPANLQDDSKNTMRVDYVHVFELVDASTPEVDDIQLSTVPEELVKGGSIDVALTYDVSEEREISVAIYSSDHDLNIETTKVVASGSGTLNMEIQVPNTLEIGDNYRIVATTRSKDTEWETYHSIAQSFVNVIEEVEIPLSATEETPTITLLPNPARDRLRVAGKLPLEKWEITDLTGRTFITGKSEEINVSALKNGMYLFLFRGETHKFMIRN
ncbi:MAG: beta-porphyranase [Bacteroidota bacterium]